MSSVDFGIEIGREPLCEQLTQVTHGKRDDKFLLYRCKRRPFQDFTRLYLKPYNFAISGTWDADTIATMLRTYRHGKYGYRVNLFSGACVRIVENPELLSLYKKIASRIISIHIHEPLGGMHSPIALNELCTLSKNSCIEIQLTNFKITTEVSEMLCNAITTVTKLEYLLFDAACDKKALDRFAGGLIGKLPNLRYLCTSRHATLALKDLIVSCKKLVYLGFYRGYVDFQEMIPIILDSCEQNPSIQVLVLCNIICKRRKGDYVRNVAEEITQRLADGRLALFDVDFDPSEYFSKGKMNPYLRRNQDLAKLCWSLKAKQLPLDNVYDTCDVLALIGQHEYRSINLIYNIVRRDVFSVLKLIVGPSSSSRKCKHFETRF